MGIVQNVISSYKYLNEVRVEIRRRIRFGNACYRI